MKHFQTQRDWKENTDPQHEEEICDFLSNEEKYSINDTTDKPFTISEVKKVKKKLKQGSPVDQILFRMKFSKAAVHSLPNQSLNCLI